MNSGQIQKLAAALLLIVLVAGCQSSGTLTVGQVKSSAIPPGKTVALTVEPAIENPDEATTEVIQRVRARLFGRLVAEGVFKQVVRPPEPADYKLEIKVQSAREVSTAARIFLGVFAGSNTLALSVLLNDTTTGELVTAFDVTGDSAAHPFSSEAGLDDAVREAVTKIIAALQ